MTSIIVDANNEIVMWSDGGAPAPSQGQQLVMLDDDLCAAFFVVLGTPNGGMAFDGKNFTALPVAVLPDPVPQEVTPLQMRMALNSMGILNQVNAYVAQQTQDMQLAWQWAKTVPITNPMVATVAQAMNVDINSLFKLAATYEH